MEMLNSAMNQIQSEANAASKQNRGILTPKLYVQGHESADGMRRGTTPEQAFAAALEDNPDAYETYRQSHNAAGLIGQLERAGVKIQFA
jgi:hypothetical protein